MEYYIVRLSKAITFADGSKSHIFCVAGKKKEVRAYAEKLAKENDAAVEEIT